MVKHAQCEHGVILPKALSCNHGYMQLRIQTKQHVICENFGPHTKETQEIAEIRLGQIRKEILESKIGIKPELPEKTFAEVVQIYKRLWPLEREGDGQLKHKPANVRHCFDLIDANLLPYFGAMKYHAIRTIDIENRRDERLKQVSGTTVNREHAPLSSIFNHVKNWIAREKIEPFKQPPVNPCESASRAPMKTHDRILTDYEVTKMFLACKTLGDTDGAEICMLILETVLSVSDLKKLELGQTIDLERSKTGVPIQIPITILKALNWSNWRKRWVNIRKEAGFCLDRKSPEFVDAKVLRKTGINWAIEQYGINKASGYAGHASEKTTERHYRVLQREKMRPLAEFMHAKVTKLANPGETGHNVKIA